MVRLLNKGKFNVFVLSGFTLIEVLVALVIVSGAFLALVKTTTHTTTSVSYLRDKTIANWVALNVLTTTMCEPVWPIIGSHEGIARMGGQSWFWEETISNTADRTMRKLEVIVKKNKESRAILIKRIGFAGEHQNKINEP